MTQTPENDAAPLGEYEWSSNGNHMTGQLSEEDAKTMDAKPVGTAAAQRVQRQDPKEQSASDRGDSDLAAGDSRGNSGEDDNLFTSTKAAAKPANKSRS